MLSVLLWAPLAFALLLLVAPRVLARWLSVAGALVALAIAIGLVVDYLSLIHI